ncbi:LytR family transcriptional regulator [bacterium D16-50]|jgi:LCP family protein required for cell wall assembly|nr:LCP family protein [Lachnospiraceae bacterium]RKJ19943.1 LytR family transcriptional regulator [bacterium D16-50]
MAKKTNRRRGKSGKGKYILFGVEVVIILVMVVVLFKVMNSDAVAGPQVTYLDKNQVAIPSQVQEQTEEGGTMHGYMNIALFGVDATTDKQLFGGSRSDSIMIANINMDTGDIKLVSVYRDTYLNAGTDSNGNENTYAKCNSAYSWGGAEQAVRMLNMNLDMDITNFVAVSYKGLSKVIDGIGGIYIDVDSEELLHINNYQIGVAEVLKTDYTPVKETGYQLLNGIQATAYCRIRQTKGDDFKRTARQREVLKAIEAQAKQLDLATLTKVFNDCIGDIYTTIDSAEILKLIGSIADYRIVDEAGFPREDLRTPETLGAKGSCVVPTDLESNVVWLHQYLFDDEDYVVTETVKECSEQIKENVAPYMKNK